MLNQAHLRLGSPYNKFNNSRSLSNKPNLNFNLNQTELEFQPKSLLYMIVNYTKSEVKVKGKIYNQDF